MLMQTHLQHDVDMCRFSSRPLKQSNELKGQHNNVRPSCACSSAETMLHSKGLLISFDVARLPVSLPGCLQAALLPCHHFSLFCPLFMMALQHLDESENNPQVRLLWLTLFRSPLIFRPPLHLSPLLSLRDIH